MIARSARMDAPLVWIPALAILLFAAGCTSGISPETRLLPPGVPNLATHPHDGRFPVGIFFPGRRDVDDFVRSWYGNQLHALGEPRLGHFVDSADTDAVRFLWLRSFHHPIAVRAIRRGSRYALVGTELDGAGGYAPGRILRQDSIAITEKEWSALVAPIRSASFWAPQPADNKGLDGAQWLVEAVEEGKLCLVDWWTPREDGPGAPVRAFGLAMVRAARIVPDEVY